VHLELASFPVRRARLGKVGANRIVRGHRFSHPCGRPELPPAEERAWRVELVRTALRALSTPVEGPTIFEPAES